MKYKIKNILNLGITNKSYLSIDNFFVRYSNSFTNLFIDHKNEILVLKKIKNKSFTLPIIDYGYDNNNFFLVTKYYSNLKSFNNIKITNNIIKEFSIIIKKLWETKICKNSKIKIFNPKKFLIIFKNIIKKKIIDLTIYEKKINYSKLYKKELVLCHNDLNKGNLVFLNRKLYLIDFEYSMLNDKFFDIASFISETLISKKKCIFLFKIFNLTLKQQNKVYLWIYYQNILWIYWANYMYEKTKKNIFLTIIDCKLKYLNNN